MRLLLALFILGAGTTLAPSPAGADETPRVLVMEARKVDLPQLGPRALREAVEETLKAQGAAVVAGKLTEKEQATCDSVECFDSASRTVDATHVLRIDAVYVSGQYELQIRMWSAATGVVAGDRDRCKLCLASDLLRGARNQTSVLCGKVLPARPTTDPSPPADRSSGPAGVQPPPSTASPAASDTRPPGTSEPPPMTQRSGVPSYVGPLVLGGAGVAGAATAVVFWLRGDRSTCDSVDESRCGRVFSGARTGAVIAVPSLIAVAGALVWWRLSLRHSAAEMSMSAVPGGLLLTGRF